MVKEMVRLHVQVPVELVTKAKAYTAELSRRVGRNIPVEELLVLALAKYVHGEHLLDIFYREKKRAAPDYIQRKTKMKKTYMDAMISQALAAARTDKE